jgi:hypothetical protein
VPLPFFRALNPLSQYSGITYRYAGRRRCQHREMLDFSVIQTICHAFHYDRDALSALSSTYEAIIGCHYDWAFTVFVNKDVASTLKKSTSIPHPY